MPVPFHEPLFFADAEFNYSSGWYRKKTAGKKLVFRAIYVALYLIGGHFSPNQASTKRTRKIIRWSRTLPLIKTKHVFEKWQ